MGSLNKYASKRLKELEAEEGGDPKLRDKLRAMEIAEDNLTKRTRVPETPPSPAAPADPDSPDKRRKREIAERLRRRAENMKNR